MSELATVEVMRRSESSGARLVRPRGMTMVIDGEIGAEELADIGEMLVRLSIDGVTELVIDLRGVSHLDYRGIPALVRRAEVFRELGGDVKLAGLSPYLFTIFQAAGASESFDFFAETKDAQNAFREAVLVQGA